VLLDYGDAMRLDVYTDKGRKWAEIHARFRLDRDIPIDLCLSCAKDEDLLYVCDDDHPPYEDYDYKCVLCKDRLTDFD
jgi:hypothetical protein